MYSQNYDSKSYIIPAPILDIFVSSDSDEEIKITALVDSGADGTILPESILERLDAPYVESRYMTGVTGKREIVELFLVSIRIGIYQINGIRAVSSVNSNEVLIGRDVINNLIVTLNGLAEVTEVQG